jgi:hypothetical protein
MNNEKQSIHEAYIKMMKEAETVVDIDDYVDVIVNGLRQGMQALTQMLLEEANIGKFENFKPESIAKRINMFGYAINRLENAEDDRKQRSIIWDIIKGVSETDSWILNKEVYGDKVADVASTLSSARGAFGLNLDWSKLGYF